jgi:L-threonylcarbamoyladenylate synthase
MKKTLVLEVDSQKPEVEKIRIAAAFIQKGDLVAFPTETVYGLGADALNPKAVLALFKAKKRPFDNPPIVHVADVLEVRRLVTKIPLVAEELMKRFWPGPLTLIFRRSEIVPDVTVAGLDTIAIRMPRHNVALALIRESGCPIAAPSANLAGKPSPTSAKHVLDDLDGRIDAVLDAGPTSVGVESTVLDLTVDPPEVLRPGGTPYETLQKILPKIKLHPMAFAERKLQVQKARSPGMMHKHYAPEADLIVVEGQVPAVVNKVKKLGDFYRRYGKKVGVLATDETVSEYKAFVVRSLGSRNDFAAIAKNLFRLLRELDSEDVNVIIAEGIPPKELGLAVMNRLRKASGYKIIKADEN